MSESRNYKVFFGIVGRAPWEPTHVSLLILGRSDFLKVLYFYCDDKLLKVDNHPLV